MKEPSSSRLTLREIFRGPNTFRNILLGALIYLIGAMYIYPYFATMYYNNKHNTMMNDATPHKKAYFAGGCFWCMEGIFEAQTGVKEAIVGYAGGKAEDATYERVGAGITDHREAVEIIYNPSIINYEKLVELYFTQIDPTQADGQFADRGPQYTTAIFVQDTSERQIASDFIKSLDTSKKFDKPIAVKVEDFTTFFPAEDYHQNYYKTSSLKYSLYKKGSGREGYIDRTWGKELEMLRHSEFAKNPENQSTGLLRSSQGLIPKKLLKQKLTPIQYEVTQEGGTERPFANEYHDNKRAGIYVDIVDGTPLFSSLDKYDSGTGWPSFTRPIDPNNVKFEEDTKLFSTRIEVRSKYADSHLGHVFDDGPFDAGGKRYCMNSASMRFIPLEDLEKEGYGEWKSLFDSKKNP